MPIGTENERTLHRELKHYFEPNPVCHEIRLGRYTADILNQSGITEIQTASFHPILKRLTFFLESHPVNVVYPVAAAKTVVWINPDTGERSAPRKSPKQGRISDILPQLFWLLPLLNAPNLTFTVVLMDMEEQRLLCGWSADRKRGSRRVERIPLEPRGIFTIGTKADYRALIPVSLKNGFTAKEFQKAARLSPRQTSAALRVLLDREAVVREGKLKNAYLYQILK